MLDRHSNLNKRRAARLARWLAAGNQGATIWQMAAAFPWDNATIHNSVLPAARDEGWPIRCSRGGWPYRYYLATTNDEILLWVDEQTSRASTTIGRTLLGTKNY